jgi:peptidyl-prolyl cis-trans isomerase SurA
MLLALPVVPLVLLAGCGVAGTEFHPGIAADVGDQTITTRHVDQVTDDYCKAVEVVSKGQQQQADAARPMRYLSHIFASALITQAGAEQLAEQYGVQPSSTYKSSLTKLEPELTKLNDDEKDAVREIVGAQAYNQDVLTQIGEISLKKQGTTNASTDDQYTEGQKVLDAWMKDHEVTVNPKYSLEPGSNNAPVDTDLSHALSASAKGGLAATPSPEYTDALPGNQVCLD